MITKEQLEIVKFTRESFYAEKDIEIRRRMFEGIRLASEMKWGVSFGESFLTKNSDGKYLRPLWNEA